MQTLQHDRSQVDNCQMLDFDILFLKLLSARNNGANPMWKSGITAVKKRYCLHNPNRATIRFVATFSALLLSHLFLTTVLFIDVAVVFYALFSIHPMFLGSEVGYYNSVLCNCNHNSIFKNKNI